MTIKPRFSACQNYEHLNLPGSYCAKCNYCIELLGRRIIYVLCTLNYSTCIKFRQVSGRFVRAIIALSYWVGV